MDKKGMSFDKYIDNPSGGASVITNRNMYKKMYKDKFDAVLVRENGSVKYELYVDKDKYDSHYIYFKIPSEVIQDFYYDVVVQLYTTDNSKKNNANLREYSVKFYSNDPAFVYTFAHSFSKNNLFITDLESRMSKQALKNVARVKNPKDNVWYVKSLYFAYLAMEKYNLFSRALYKSAKNYNSKELCKKVMKADDKIQLRQAAGERLQKEKSKEKEKIKAQPKPTTTNTRNMVKTSSVTRTSKISSNIKSVKRTKVSKKI